MQPPWNVCDSSSQSTVTADPASMRTAPRPGGSRDFAATALSRRSMPARSGWSRLTASGRFAAPARTTTLCPAPPASRGVVRPRWGWTPASTQALPWEGPSGELAVPLVGVVAERGGADDGARVAQPPLDAACCRHRRRRSGSYVGF